MLIPTKKVTDGEKKNSLILYAQTLGCKAIYNEEHKGMCIEVSTRKQQNLIKEKIKELE